MGNDESCAGCGRTLTRDEIGMTRKLISRAASGFFCWDCLAARFDTDVPKLKDMAEHFRQEGCMLFN